MTPKDYDNLNHNYILEFLINTQNDKSDISGSVKCTIAQFLQHLRQEINTIGWENDNIITSKQLVESQIKVLRQCIVDLQKVLNRLEKEEIIQ